MRFGSAVRVSGRVAAAVALEDLIREDWDNRKDAALRDFALRRILFFREGRD